MSDINQVIVDWDRVVDTYGMTIWRAIGSKIYGSNTDYDEATWVSAGSETVKAIVLPLSKRMYSAEQQYVIQGALQEKDYKMFVKASGTYNTEDRYVFGGGSYWTVKMQPPALPCGSEVYKKIYIRKFD